MNYLMTHDPWGSLLVEITQRTEIKTTLVKNKLVIMVNMAEQEVAPKSPKRKSILKILNQTIL